jgi:hypothetical protein
MAGAEAGPGSQTVGVAESTPVGTDLDDPPGGADEIDAGDRLRQG